MSNFVSPPSGERSQRQSDFSPNFRRDHLFNGNDDDDDDAIAYLPSNAPGSPSAASASRLRNSHVNTNFNNNNNNYYTSSLSPLERERKDENRKLKEIANDHVKSQDALIDSMFITQNNSPTRKQYIQLSNERRHFRILVQRVLQDFGTGSSSSRLAMETISKDALLANYFTPSQGNLHQVEKLTQLRDLGNKINNNNMTTTTTMMQKVEEVVIENPNDDKYKKFQTELNAVVENCIALKEFLAYSFDSSTGSSSSSYPRVIGNGEFIFCTPQVCISWLKLIRQASIFAQDVYDYNTWNKIIIDKIRKNNNANNNISQQQQQRSRSRQDNDGGDDRKSPSPNAPSSRSFFYGGDSSTNLLLVSPQNATELFDAVNDLDQKRAYIFDEARRRNLQIPGEFGESTIRRGAASQPRREESRNNISQQRKQQSQSPSCGQSKINNNANKNNNSTANVVDEQHQQEQEEQRNSIHEQVVNSIRRGDRSTYHLNKIRENIPVSRSDPCVELFSNNNNNNNSISNDNVAGLAEEQNTTKNNNNNNADTKTSVKQSVNVGAHDFGIAGDDRNNLDAQVVPGHDHREFDLKNRGPSKILQQAMSPQAVYHLHNNKSAPNHDLAVANKNNAAGDGDDDGASEILAANENGPAKPKKEYLTRGGGKNNTKNNNNNKNKSTTATTTNTKQNDQNPNTVSQATLSASNSNKNNIDNNNATQNATGPSSSSEQQQHQLQKVLSEPSATTTSTLLTPRRQLAQEQEAKFGVASPDAARCVPLDLDTRRKMHFFLDPTYNSIMTKVTHKHHPRYYDVAENGAIMLVMPFYYFAAFFYFGMVLYCRPDDGYDRVTSHALALFSVVIIFFGMYDPEGSITVNAKSIPRILKQQRATGRVNPTLVQMHEAAKFCEFYSNRKETIELEKKIEETKQLIVGALVATGHARKVILPKHYADTHLIQLNERRFYGELADRQQQQQQNNNDDQNGNNNNNNNSIRGGTTMNNNNNNNNNNVRSGTTQQIGGGARTTTNGGTPIHGVNTVGNSNNNNNVNRVVTSNNNNNSRAGLPPTGRK